MTATAAGSTGVVAPAAETPTVVPGGTSPAHTGLTGAVPSEAGTTSAAPAGAGAAGAMSVEAVPGVGDGGQAGGAVGFGGRSFADALRLRGIRAGYGGAPVLRGVELAVRAGEILVLLGPNGAGKSTTCRVAAGLVSPLAGQVYVAGRDATRDGAVRRSRAGVVLAPEGRGIFPALTVEENLGLYLRGRDGRDARDAVYRRFPGLAGRRGVPAGALSGGEQQMLALAPLLQRPPKVLIADEPSLGLAPRVVEEVFRLLTELRDQGTALLLVEEKATEVLKVADSVAYLARGRVTWCGPRAAVEADRLTEAYLGLAATREGAARP
ncbi:ABC transporter ATP-binding protein [Streptomyces dioscori]|uniref:ABC transporter ATP-binding protein n=2 Tax=Streptomyces dioscori TaxID=2109333 RepID=A0A2P8QAQ0_9ACTN|nr:ABC transporter ATP-binding protein [Streptomyces dioscori]